VLRIYLIELIKKKKDCLPDLLDELFEALEADFRRRIGQ
jgi:hypothetical protein